MRRLLLFAAGALTMMGCRLDMHDQPRYRYDAASDFWGDRRAARPQIAGTVARGSLKTDTALYTGKQGEIEIDYFPMPVTKEMIARGQTRFNIYCSPCHGITGHGDGIIVTRGLKNPPSYHTEALRETTPGHIFNVITNGNGSMYSYASRIPPDDRWAIAAYVKVLQQSQNVPAAELSNEQRTQLDAKPADAAKPGEQKQGGAH